MSKDPAFLFYPGDYLRDTQCLSESVQVAYDRIMCEHMRNICISQSQLNFFTKRLSDDEKSELDMVLTKVDGGFQISWVAESIVKRKAYSESRRNNRTSKPKETSLTYDEHMENEDENESKDESTIILKESKNKIFSKTLLESHSWVEAICRQNKITESDVTKWIDRFNLKLDAELDVKTNKSDYASHFTRWVSNEVLKNPNQGLPTKKRVIS